MLKKFRSRQVKIVFWILIILIVPPFFFWGVTSFTRARRENANIFIDGKHISSEEFREYQNTSKIYYRLIMGRDFSKQINQEMLDSKALEFLLLLWKAKKDKITVSDKEVIETIEKIFSVDGRFDKDLYLRYTKEGLGILPRTFEEYIRMILLSEKIIDLYVRNVEVSDDEVKEAYKKANEKVKISYIFVPYKNFEKEDEQTKALAENFAKGLIKEITENNTFELEPIAKKYNLEVKTTDYFTYNEPIPNFGFEEEIYQDIFSLKKNQISEKLFLLPEGIAIVRLDDFLTIDDEKFNEEKENYRNWVKSQKMFTRHMNFIYQLRKESNLKFPAQSLDELSLKDDNE
ncbi:MAG: peptidylprolyl isomerase [Candidatus Omnitrophica bacterium]|nr:peptidylprolyl isomerase [Candidatus Omnitrophota bacterium]